MTFLLSEEEIRSFPVSTESLWLDKVGSYFQVKNIPMFIEGMAYDDIIKIKTVGDNLYQLDSVKKVSGNSNIWVLLKDFESTVTDKLIKVGCGVEGGALDGYFAINVPKNNDWNKVAAILDNEESEDKIVIDYPVFRHEEE